MTQNELTFEKALEKLENIVIQLEQEDIPLEKAIDLYQSGMSMSKLCSEKLTTAEEKIVKILNNSNETEPFEVEEN